MAKISFISFFDELCAGIRYVASAVEESGHDLEIILIKIFKDSLTPPSPEMVDDKGYYGELFYVSEGDLHLLLEHIKKSNPDIIGMSIFSHFTGVAAWTTRQIKKEFPDIPILWGGIDVLANPENSIRIADMICIGDGQYPMVDVLNAIDVGRDPAEVKNIWTRRNGKIIRQPNRPNEPNIDNYPLPRYDHDGILLIRNGKIQPFDPSHPENFKPDIITARGCPYRCSYCYPAVEREVFPDQKPFRQNSVDYVMKNIRKLLKYYPDIYYLAFSDDVFAINQEWAEEFRDKYRKEFGLPFRCYIQQNVSNKKLLETLKEAGLDVVVIGVQTASRRILDNVYNRPMYPEKTRQKLKECHELGIWMLFDLILFNPYETEDDLKVTLDFVKNLERPYGFPFLGSLMMFENFPITRQVKKDGLKIRPLDNSNTFFSNENRALHSWYYGLFGLAAMEAFPRTSLDEIVEKKYFRDNPEELVKMMRGIRDGAYYFVDELWVEKERLMTRMNALLQTIEGSRALQLASKVRNLSTKIRTIYQGGLKDQKHNVLYSSPVIQLPLREQLGPNPSV